MADMRIKDWKLVDNPEDTGSYRMIATVGDMGSVWTADSVEDIPPCEGGSHHLFNTDREDHSVGTIECPCGNWRQAVKEAFEGQD